MICATFFACSGEVISLQLFSLGWSPAGGAGVHFNLGGEQRGRSVRVGPACDPASYLTREDWWDIRQRQRISQQEAKGSLSGD